MIDREKVIKGLEICIWFGTGMAYDCTGCPYDTKELETKCITEMQEDVIELLKELGWHMLTEDDDGIIHGMPGDDGQYLMTDGKDIWIDDYVDGVSDGIILDSGRDIREIKAWMYMPEPPGVKNE